ncbi:hypothetical protein [Holdemanella biformis]|uniref:hypothetical protein n=1 Tax=Holdemanella biformis TaxID=1735 RepID=UPI0022E7714B|nr:hypothetical protein [Holdemanella biformis]
MSNINLYKIDSRKKDEFLKNLNEKFDNENNVEITSKCKYGISVYMIKQKIIQIGYGFYRIQNHF